MPTALQLAMLVVQIGHRRILELIIATTAEMVVIGHI